jgi:anion-transporting  ArsA/GET3 family ATPase
LIELSRHLKALVKLLHDPSGAQLFAVSILTEMALEETKDLVATCERLAIYVPAIFLNLATPAGECSVCSALHRQEDYIRYKFQQLFPDKQLPLIYRTGEPRGVPRLLELGQAMYTEVGKEAPSYVC